MSSSDTSMQRETHTPVRKRIRKPEQWKKSVVKKKRQSGEKYVSRTTKMEVAARTVGPPCSCTKQCYELIGMEYIKEIFVNYWALADHSAQTSYINSRVRVENVAKSDVGEASRRKNTHVYTVLAANTPINVCLTAFINIHGISEKRVRSALKKSTGTGSTVSGDQRGKHTPHNKTKHEVKELIEAHINQLPSNTSHYSRVKSVHRVYLPPGSSRATLYEDYVRWLNEQYKGHLKASFRVYTETLNTFNIGIEPPNSDIGEYSYYNN